MKKDLKATFTSPWTRFSAYIILFVAILASIEISHILLTIPRNIAITLSLTIISVYVLIGGLFVGTRNIFSHVTSFSTMGILATIALVFDAPMTSGPLLLLLLVGVSYLGARPFLHRKPATRLRAVCYSITTVTAAVLFSISFIVAVWHLTRIAM